MNPNQYTDVVSTNVNYSYIEKMVDEGIMDAETDNEFGAEKAMTRQGLLTALYRMEKNPLVLDGENTFADVDYKADNELGRALKWAENSNLFAGLNEGFFTENKFEADKSLSKQEAVQIVYNYASKKRNCRHKYEQHHSEYRSERCRYSRTVGEIIYEMGFAESVCGCR